MPMILKTDPANDRMVMQAVLMNQLKRDMDYAFLLNPWVWSPDPLIHSLRWLKRGQRITVTRWKSL